MHSFSVKILLGAALASVIHAFSSSFAGVASADVMPTYYTEECKDKKEGDPCAVPSGERGTCKTTHDKRSTEGFLACSDLKPLMWTDLHPSPSADRGKRHRKGDAA
jgi:hypothetical protein